MTSLINSLKNPVVASLVFTGFSAALMGGSKAVSWLGRKIEAYGTEREEDSQIKCFCVQLGLWMQHAGMQHSGKVFKGSLLATALGAFVSLGLLSCPFFDYAARTWPRGEMLY